MKLTKILMIVLLFWMIPAALIPIFDLVVWFPYVSPTNIPTDDLANHRLLSVRSAAFLTIVYFIINHLRQKKPLSSVSPIFVYVNCVLLFSTILLIKNSGPVIINKGSGFFKTRIPMMLEKISPKDADKKVLIKINGIFKSIAPFAPPLNPNQPNHKIKAPSAAMGVLLP